MAHDVNNVQDPSNYDVVNKVGHIAVPYKHFILVWGGFQGCETSTEGSKYCPANQVWLYNPLTELWNSVHTTGEGPEKNSGATGLVLDDNLYVFGGMEEINGEYVRYTNNLYRLNLVSYRWELLHPGGLRPVPCDKGTGWTYGNKLYLFGGYGQKPNNEWFENGPNKKLSYVPDTTGVRPGVKGWNNQLVCYDPGDNTWSWLETRRNPPPPRAACDADIDRHRVFLFGGRLESTRTNDLYVLDMRTLEWSHNLTEEAECEVPLGCSWHSFKLVKPNTFILFGGVLQSGIPSYSWWILEVDDTLKLNWKMREMPVPLCWHRAVFSKATQELIVIGGVCVSPYDMLLSDHVSYLIVIQLEPPSLFRECLQKLTLEQSNEHLDVLPSFMKRILDHRHSQLHLNKKTITL